jgi:hypothetical protein
VSCQLSTSIATRVESRITRFDSTLEAVSVITVCRPPTSLASLDWISPVRVAVKNRRGMLWRCSYSVARRLRITLCPTVLVR